MCSIFAQYAGPIAMRVVLGAVVLALLSIIIARYLIKFLHRNKSRYYIAVCRVMTLRVSVVAFVVGLLFLGIVILTAQPNCYQLL